jgi:Protein of unknown function (DUF4238)
MEYPKVKNAHIVPRTYLEGWAVDGKIAAVQVHEKKRLELAVENVGTRRQFYRRRRPDGSEIDDIEWTLSEIESNAAPLLQSFDEEWPFSGDDKLKLAVLFAFQLLRTPRWRESYEAHTRSFFDEYGRSNPTTLTSQELQQQNEYLLSDTHRLGMMLSTGVTGSGVFASMHWTLMSFDRPLIATSDHPLVLWHGTASRSPQAAEITQIGILECVEIRLPLSPTHAVLMTWSDAPDDEHVRVQGTRDHAANLNAFTVAYADRQWFHRPGPTPPITSGYLRPLSLSLVPSYTATAAAASERRGRASEMADRRVGRDFRDLEVEVVTVTRPKRL